MVVKHLKNKRDCCKGYVFEYVADEEGTIWFLYHSPVLITTSAVTLAIGLISNEDVDSYTWLLECFRKSIFHLPSVLVTDQDLAMKASIAKIFPESTHRFCMWHIAEKMKPNVLQTNFMKNISTTIWSDHIHAADFEEQWKCVIEKHGLEGHIWLSNIYRIRTSSILVSENSFFGRVLHNQMTLVEFYMAFDRALDMQRNTIWTLDNESIKYSPILKTELDIERHSANIFTHNIFKEF
ncbi:hypothetical protein QQ045_011194 [Rhodiola kirilowii]